MVTEVAAQKCIRHVQQFMDCEARGKKSVPETDVETHTHTHTHAHNMCKKKRGMEKSMKARMRGEACLEKRGNNS